MKVVSFLISIQAIAMEISKKYIFKKETDVINEYFQILISLRHFSEQNSLSSFINTFV
eukprot:Pgem_evm1s19394